MLHNRRLQSALARYESLRGESARGLLVARCEAEWAHLSALREAAFARAVLTKRAKGMLEASQSTPLAGAAGAAEGGASLGHGAGMLGVYIETGQPFRSQQQEEPDWGSDSEHVGNGKQAETETAAGVEAGTDQAGAEQQEGEGCCEAGSSAAAGGKENRAPEGGATPSHHGQQGRGQGQMHTPGVASRLAGLESGAPALTPPVGGGGGTAAASLAHTPTSILRQHIQCRWVALSLNK